MESETCDFNGCACKAELKLSDPKFDLIGSRKVCAQHAATLVTRRTELKHLHRLVITLLA